MPDEPTGEPRDRGESRPVPQGPLSELGESGLLAHVFDRLPVGPGVLVGPGDDAAVVAAPDARVVATTDVLVEGRDFRRDWSTAADVGWKAAAQNLADVAAMGAVPTALLVGLVAPPDLPAAWALGLTEGLAEGCAGTGATVVGGDLSSGDSIVVAVTALGDLEGRAPVLRSGARPGDVLALAGRPGRSAAGLDLLHADRGGTTDPSLAALVLAHRRPRPPYAAGPAASAAGATAMLDVSDGVLRDAGRLARASGVGVDLSRSELDVHTRALAEAEWALEAPGRAWQWVLTGGEDHGLLVTFPAGTTLPEGFAVLGRVLPAAGGPPVTLDGQDPAEVVTGVGWDHFGG